MFFPETFQKNKPSCGVYFHDYSVAAADVLGSARFTAPLRMQLVHTFMRFVLPLMSTRMRCTFGAHFRLLFLSE